MNDKFNSTPSYLRRKQRAAFISMCAACGIRNIPYAGVQVVAGLSDGCIRDYLEIMAEIFDAFPAPDEIKVKRFYTRRSPLTIPVQRQAIVRASETKFSGIKTNAESYGTELAKLVECLGILTGLLHRDVRTAERGVFSLNVSDIQKFNSCPASHVKDLIITIVSRGESDGLIRPVKVERAHSGESPYFQTLKFRLHRRFAPKFGFSFRGPYEPAALPWDMMADICFNADLVNASQWASQVFLRLSGIDPEQQELAS